MRSITAACVLAVFGACVPTDRDEVIRGAVFVHLTPSAPGERTFLTEDGYLVNVERMFGTIGISVTDPVPIDAPTENSCADSRTGRETFGLVDFAYPFDLEERGHYPKTCGVRGTFVLSPVGDLLRRGPGISDADARGLRSLGEDEGAALPALRYARIVGTAIRGERSLRFDWWIARNLSSPLIVVEPPRALVTVPNGDKVDVAVSLDPSQLFRVSLVPEATTRFGAIAALDENDDGLISTSELEILWSELSEELPHYTLPSLDLSIQDFLGLQLDAAWRSNALP